MDLVRAAATGTLRVTERSYPTSEVGAEAGRTPCLRSGGQEELTHVRGQGQQPRVPGCDGTGTAERSYPSPRSGAAAERIYPASEVRGGDREKLPHTQGQGLQPEGATPRLTPWLEARRSYPTAEARSGGREDQPHVQGVGAAWVPEGLEELLHVQGQDGRW